MQFESHLTEALFIRRYKRFLVDVQLADGSEITAHCPNTGSMKHCLFPGEKVWMSHSPSPSRKYAYTWELAASPDGSMICINTRRANEIIKEAILEGKILQLGNVNHLVSEKKYGAENSRIDFYLPDTQSYIEVKSVTLAKGNQGYFPDSPSLRGQKHLRELTAVAKAGKPAFLIYCVNHSAIETVAPAKNIDPDYTRLLREAMHAGVNVLCYKTAFSLRGMTTQKSIPLLMN